MYDNYVISLKISISYFNITYEALLIEIYLISKNYLYEKQVSII